MFKRSRKTVPGLNTMSTADISFMLLIFFLMTSSMDTDKGLTRQLPPLSPEEAQEQTVSLKERNTLKLAITADDNVLLDGKTISMEQLKTRIIEFVSNEKNIETLPEKTVKDVELIGKFAVSDKHVIHIELSPDARYDTYFKVQNQIVNAYGELRDALGRSKFGRPYSRCNDTEKAALRDCYPQHVSETGIESSITTSKEEGGEE